MIRTVAPIGIAGKMGHGKSTVARYLAERFGCIEYALADAVRNSLFTLNPLVDATGRRVQDVIQEEADWQRIKADPVLGPEIRGLLQRFGTDVGRKTLGEPVWLLAAEQYLDARYQNWWHETKGPQVVISDIRFDNEARWVQLNRGVVINVVRKPLPPAQEHEDHESENGIDPYLANYTIWNVGSLDELYGQADHIYRQEFGFVRSA